MTTPVLHDYATWTAAPASTQIAIDLSTLDVPSSKAFIRVYTWIGTTSSLFSLVNTNDTRLQRGVVYGPSAGNPATQLFTHDWFIDPTAAGPVTISWTGATGINAGMAISLAMVFTAGTEQVYAGHNDANGPVGASTFDSAIITPNGDRTEDALYVLLTGVNGASAVTTTSSPTGWSDNVYNTLANQGSNLAIAGIDRAIAASTSHNPTTWTYSAPGGTSGNAVGFSVFSTANESPANDDFENAVAMTGCEGSTTGTTLGAGIEQDEFDLNSYPGQGYTVWYTFTGKSGEFIFDVTSATGYPTFYLYEGTAGDSLATVLNGFVSEDANNGGSFTTDYSATYSSLDPTKQYWIQVDTYRSVGIPDQADFTLTWTSTTGTCTDCVSFVYRDTATSIVSGLSTPLPTYAAGDVLVASFRMTGGSLSGWEQIAISAQNFFAVYYRVADGSEGSTLTLPVGSNTYPAVVSSWNPDQGMTQTPIIGFGPYYDPTTGFTGYQTSSASFSDPITGDFGILSRSQLAPSGEISTMMIAIFAATSFPATYEWNHGTERYVEILGGAWAIAVADGIHDSTSNSVMNGANPSVHWGVGSASSFVGGLEWVCGGTYPTAVSDTLSTVATIDHDLIIGTEPDQHHSELHDLAGFAHTGGFVYISGIDPVPTDADITDAGIAAATDGQIITTYDISSLESLIWIRMDGTWDLMETTE